MKQRTFEVPVELEATRANLDGDPLESVTYQQAKLKRAFPKFFFLFGRWYGFTYENGTIIYLKRNTERLYSGNLGKEFQGLEFAPKGPRSKVVHRVVSIKEMDESFKKDNT